jgi:hypothetical protein
MPHLLNFLKALHLLAPSFPSKGREVFVFFKKKKEQNRVLDELGS